MSKTALLPSLLVDSSLPTMHSGHLSRVLFSPQVLSGHGVVLSRGLMVEPPSIQQILGGQLAMVTDSNEQKFLQDFIESKTDTAGGRLAR